jgi:hypothetical protein
MPDLNFVAGDNICKDASGLVHATDVGSVDDKDEPVNFVKVFRPENITNHFIFKTKLEF